MAITHPSLTQRTTLEDMEIGDVISCEYAAASGAIGTFANLGNATKDVILPASVAAPNGSFYFVKVDENLLVADRVVQHSITWDALNAGGYIEGSLLIKNHNVQNYIATGNYDTTKNLAQLNDPSGSVLFPLYYKTRPIGNEYLQYNYLEPVIVNNMKLRTRGTASGFEPLSKFKICGSNNNFSTEVELFNGIYSTPDSFQDFNFINSAAFSSYRIYLTEWIAGNLGDGANIDRLFLGESIGLIRSLSGGSAYIDYLEKKEVALHLPLVSDIVDKSPIPRSVTITGTSTMPVVQEGAGKFGNNSVYFDGTNSALTLPNKVCNFGTRDFTIDCWAKIPLAPVGTYDALISNTNGTNIWHGIYLVDNDASYKIGVLNHTVRILQSTKRIDDDIYHHIAIQRRNGILQIFIDGIVDASINYTADINWNIVPNIYIGGATATPTHPLKGYINDLRIIKGTGIYEGNFTPPTGLLPKQVSELDIPIMSTTNLGSGGFPNTNEWDKYIVNSDLEGKITPGDNNIWNCTVGAWSKETPSTGVLGVTGVATANTNRTFRGFIDSYGGVERINFAISTSNTVYHGFRPVLQLIDNKQTTFWR